MKLFNEYRPCRNLKEFYELITGAEYSNHKKSNEEYVSYLIGKVIHMRIKGTNTEFRFKITKIARWLFTHLIFSGSACGTLREDFKLYEIEINGEWKPFGVRRKFLIF